MCLWCGFSFWCFGFWDKVSFNPSWPWTCYISGNDFELWFSCFYLPSARITSVFTMLSTIGCKTSFMLGTIILHSKPNLQPILVYFYKNPGWISNTAKRRACSMLLRVDVYFDFIIISAENTSSHKYILQIDRYMLRVILEIVGNFCLNPKPKFIIIFLGNPH